MSPAPARPKKPRPRSARPARPAATDDALRVRVYNVLFGDAVLVSVPDRDEAGRAVARHILIDVGNVTGKGGDGDVFRPVIDDVLAVLDGQPLDLYVMTHEHMDHVKGLPYAQEHLGVDVKKRLDVQYAWLTASAAPDYYDLHPEAKKRRVEAEERHRTVTRFLLASYLTENPGVKVPRAALGDLTRFAAAVPERAPPAFPPALASLLLNNDLQSTSRCVDYLRGLAGKDRTFYIHREADLKGKHPFTEARIEVWAPEEDTTEYYGRFRPFALPVAPPDDIDARPALAAPIPPPGVDAGAFYDLVRARQRGYGDALLQIDAAANNSSIVFCLEWGGWRLLFPGDAEERSWKAMKKNGKLRPVHFLKVGHHGSHNGTPPPELLDEILPPKPPDDRPRRAAVSTCSGVYGKTGDTAVPHEGTMNELRRRCELVSVEGLGKGAWRDFTFPRGRPPAPK